MKKLLRKLLFGETVIKEYSTVTCNFINEQVHLQVGKEWIDVASVHYLLCLEPIVFGIWLKKEDISLFIEKENNYSLSFYPVDEHGKKNLLAKASLEYLNKIEVSEIPYTYKELIYQLGKHHGTHPPSPDSLPFKVKRTDKWNFFIPDWVESYKEIKILKNIDLGSHMLLWGEIENQAGTNN